MSQRKSGKEQAYGSANGTYRPSPSIEQKMFTIIATERGKCSERYFEKEVTHVYVKMKGYPTGRCSKCPKTVLHESLHQWSVPQHRSKGSIELVYRYEEEGAVVRKLRK